MKNTIQLYQIHLNFVRVLYRFLVFTLSLCVCECKYEYHLEIKPIRNKKIAHLKKKIKEPFVILFFLRVFFLRLQALRIADVFWHTKWI